MPGSGDRKQGVAETFVIKQLLFFFLHFVQKLHNHNKKKITGNTLTIIQQMVEVKLMLIDFWQSKKSVISQLQVVISVVQNTDDILYPYPLILDCKDLISIPPNDQYFLTAQFKRPKHVLVIVGSLLHYNMLLISCPWLSTTSGWNLH